MAPTEPSAVSSLWEAQDQELYDDATANARTAHGQYGPHLTTSRQSWRGRGTDRLVKTHCCFCGVQCGIQQGQGNAVIGFEPGGLPVNRGMLCPKGSSATSRAVTRTASWPRSCAARTVSRGRLAQRSITSGQSAHPGPVWATRAALRGVTHQREGLPGREVCTPGPAQSI